MRVFRILVERPTEATKTTAALTSDRPSIVVLPFADMSPEKDQEYFCDGMAEEVINALTQLEGLHVVARTSAFSFKGRDIDIREIGDKLGVRSVLEGSVRKAGDRLRVTAQLINVEDGYHLWSERFDRKLDDVFAVQDEISASIVETLKVKLAVRASPQIAKSTESPEAYDLYLLAVHHYWQQTETGLRSSIECYERAIALDPHYAQAHAGLANTYGYMTITGFCSTSEVRPQIHSAANRALQLDDSLAEAHVALATVNTYFDWNWTEAEREYRRALELNPGLSEVHNRFATTRWSR